MQQCHYHRDARFLPFDARSSQARCQPASVLLRLVGFILVGEHHIDYVARARPQTPDRQLFCDLIDLESIT